MIQLNRQIVRPTINKTLSIQSVITRTPSVLDPILYKSDEIEKDGIIKRYGNSKRDVSLLLNQIRIDNLDTKAIIDYFNTQASPTLQELREHVTDEQLLETCKSRYIQRVSEMQMYFNNLERQFNNDAKGLIDYINSQKAASTVSTDE